MKPNSRVLFIHKPIMSLPTKGGMTKTSPGRFPFGYLQDASVDVRRIKGKAKLDGAVGWSLDLEGLRRKRLRGWRGVAGWQGEGWRGSRNCQCGWCIGHKCWLALVGLFGWFCLKKEKGDALGCCKLGVLVEVDYNKKV